MSGPNMPIIRLEVEHLRQCIMHAFADQQIQYDKIFQQVLQEATTEEAIVQAVRDAVRTELRTKVQEAVKKFFSWGSPGYSIVYELIERQLKEDKELIDRISKIV